MPVEPADEPKLVLNIGIGNKCHMPTVAQVLVHASQFPENVCRDLLESLRTRRVNHKFHYDSIKQTQKWLALHEACSPARTDANVAAIYHQGFAAAADRIPSERVHVIGLGCGGGQKDLRLLQLLKDRGKGVFYTPVDVSTAMVLVAREAALAVVAGTDCQPLVCDLATADDLARVLDEKIGMDTARLITFFGMIPNFEPQAILPRLLEMLRREDSLLLSANLAPGADYAAGVRRILPQYDNALTRDWLMTFFRDLGVEPGDGDLRFVVEDCPAATGLKRVAVYFHFGRSHRIEIGKEGFEFRADESIRLFFSYRHTPDRIRELMTRYHLSVVEEWTATSGEEGVFLVGRR